MTEIFLHIKKGGYVSKDLLLAYVNGSLSEDENKRIAKLMEADPFLADAVEGLKLADKNTIAATLDNIYKDVDIIVGNKKAFTLSAGFKKYAAAAMILVFFGLTFLIMNQLNNSANQQTEIALAPENKSMPVIDDSSDMGAGSVSEDSNTAVSISKNNFNKLAEKDILRNTDALSFEKDEVADGEKYVFEESAKEANLDTEDMDSYTAVSPAETTAGTTITAASTDNVVENETVVMASKKDVNVRKEKKEKTSSSEATSKPVYTISDKNNASDTLLFVEQMPEFPGGTKALNTYLITNINYAQCANAEGTIYVKFIVTSLGSVSTVTITKGINASADAEVVRVVKTMPNWIPGKQNGKPVDVWLTIPVKLGIDE